MPKLVVFFCFILANTFLYSQREYNTNYTKEDIKIDGDLDEAIWFNSELATDFVTNYPKFGEKAINQTEVYLFYSDDAIYVGGRVLDNVDSVSYFMSQRDNFGNADYVGFTIDTYGNYLNGFAFYVTAAGVELDALINQDDFDYSWNAVWKSRTKPQEYGWSFEMRIPYSAIRFPNKEVQTWNINFERQIRRRREVSFWNPVDPAKFGEIAQAGKLNGVEKIKPPIRLSFSPYGVTYLENAFNDETGKQEWNTRTTGGMDLKWGLNDAFTLDMTLVPDFGQTISDNRVLNLGPFEVAFDENRPFFKEGTDLFGIGNVFYSRRIGGDTYRSQRFVESQLDESIGEEVVSTVSRAPLLNASKISGRTKKGLGIGFFNAIEGQTSAIIEDDFGRTRSFETNPYTNYNVAVLSQNLENNGRISFLNTNVTRAGEARDANVSVLNSTLFTDNLDFRIQNVFKLSNVMVDGENVVGHNYFASVGKVQGRFNYNFSYYEESDTYNPNDLGLLFANNSRGITLRGSVNNFVPKGKFLRKWFNFGVNYEELYVPRLFSNLNFWGGVVGTFRNFLTAGIDGDVSPVGFVNHFESRVQGVPVYFNPSFRLGGFYSSDYSKKYALDVRVNRRTFIGVAQSYNRINVAPRIQFSPRMFLVYTAQYESYERDYGYILPLTDVGGAVMVGNRNRDIVTNSISGEFIFTKRMGMNLRFRHYWQQVDYYSFSEIGNDGRKIDVGYFPKAEDGSSAHNTTFNFFTVDVNYKWVFYPGCELQVFYKNNIESFSTILDDSYFSTFETLFDQPQFNSISCKVLIFLDVLYFKRKNKEIRA